jgi:DNA-binding beta-propeller fold protein YncE
MKGRILVTFIMLLAVWVGLSFSSLNTPRAQSQNDAYTQIDTEDEDDGFYEEGTVVDIPQHPQAFLQNTGPGNLVYAGDNLTTGANIRIFRRDDMGRLTFIKDVPTGGKGLFDLVGVTRTQTGIFAATDIGPFEHDGNLIITPDKSRIFVVNQGSDDLSVFNVSADGLTLTPVPGSPFKTGHIPASVTVAAFDTVVVLNKNDDPGGQKIIGKQGSVQTYKMAANGSLTPVAGSEILLPTARGGEGIFKGQTTTPSQVLAVGDGKLIFVNDFFAGMIRPFTVNPDGTLKAGKAFDIRSLGINVLPINGRNFPFTLNFMNFPGKNILYAGILFENKVGVFTFNPKNGKLKFQGTATNRGSTVCWFVISPSGKFMWTSNQASNSVSTYSLADPLKPVETQVINFDSCGEPSQVAINQNASFIYFSASAVTNKCPQTNPDTRSNMIHTLQINPANGEMTELSPPFIMMDLPLGERIEGIAAK